MPTWRAARWSQDGRRLARAKMEGGSLEPTWLRTAMLCYAICQPCYATLSRPRRCEVQKVSIEFGSPCVCLMIYTTNTKDHERQFYMKLASVSRPRSSTQKNILIKKPSALGFIKTVCGTIETKYGERSNRVRDLTEPSAMTPPQRPRYAFQAHAHEKTKRCEESSVAWFHF